MRFSEIVESDFHHPLFAQWIAAAVGFVFAIIIGYWIGQGARQTLFLFAVTAVIILATVSLGERGWVLILITWAFYGNTEILRLPFSVRDCGVMLAACGYIGYHAMRKSDAPRKTYVLDGLLLVNMLWVFITFLLHPVGFRAIGSEQVGGRMYLNIGLAVTAYWVISNSSPSVRAVSRIPLFVLASYAALTLFHVIAYVFPQTTGILYRLYGSLDIEYYFEAAYGGNIRLKGLVWLGWALFLTLCSYYPPSTLFKPGKVRFYLMLLALGCILAAGYRNYLLLALVALFLGSWLHRGRRELVTVTLVGCLFFGLLGLGQGRLYDLPLAAQRTLTFLPGNWSDIAKEEAVVSNESRFEWWKEIIREHRIKNWWVGDGSRISYEDLLGLGRNFKEDMTLSGGFHNGPLSAIRYAGLIGLVLQYVLMIAEAVYAVQCVNRCRGTPLFGTAVFLAIQAIWSPFHYTLVYGAYNSQMPDDAFRIGLLLLVVRMVEKIKDRRAHVGGESLTSLPRAAAARTG